MAIDIDSRMRRTWRYWYEDGLVEMGTGGLFVVAGMFCLLQAWLPPGSGKEVLWTFGLPLILLGGWVAGRLVQAVKERLTYPRTGYVGYWRERGRRAASRLLVGAALGALVGAILAVAPGATSWMPALQGILVGGASLHLGHRLELARFYAVAIVSTLVGAVLSLAGLADMRSNAVYFATLGVALVASGGLALRAYLEHTRPPVGAEDYGQ